MKRSLGLISRLVPVVFLASSGACNNSRPTNAISVDPARSGSELTNTSSKFYDGLPTVSDDGSLVAFISGRDSIAGIADVRKAYKATWAKGAAPAALARVTTKELGNERLVEVSPDGQWLVLQAEKAGQYDLYLQDAAGQKDPVAITSDTAVESAMRFSPDSKLLVWIKQALDKSTSVAVIAAVGSGTAADLAQQVVVSATSDFVQQVFWIPATSGYILAVGTVKPQSLASGVTYTQRSFATISAAAAATSTAWLSGFPARSGIVPSAASDQALMVRTSTRDDGTPDDVSTPQLGSWVPPPLVNTNVPVGAEPDYRALTAGAPAQRYSPAPGYDVAAAAIASDGKTTFLLGRFYYRCADDSYDHFGAAFAIGTADHSKPLTIVSPRLTATDKSQRETYVNAFDFASGGLCDRKRADGTVSRIDDKMLEMAVMRGATASTYRIAYTTPIAPHFDGYCNLKAADQEVWLLDVHDGKQTFYPLSQNQAQITDTDRGRDGQCPWPLGVL